MAKGKERALITLTQLHEWLDDNVSKCLEATRAKVQWLGNGRDDKLILALQDNQEQTLRYAELPLGTHRMPLMLRIIRAEAQRYLAESDVKKATRDTYSYAKIPAIDYPEEVAACISFFNPAPKHMGYKYKVDTDLKTMHQTFHGEITTADHAIYPFAIPLPKEKEAQARVLKLITEQLSSTMDTQAIAERDMAGRGASDEAQPGLHDVQADVFTGLNRGPGAGVPGTTS